MPSSAIASILKSPVMTTMPTGVLIAKATASAIEWFTWMNSTWKQPALTVSPASWVWSWTTRSRWCSSSFSFTSPAVRRVAWMGHLNCCIA